MSTNSTFQDYNEYKIAVGIWTYCPPFLLAIGTVANILSIVVLLQPSLRQCRTMFYLLVLSFSDICALYTGLLRFWLKYAFELDFRLMSEFGCRFHGFLVYTILDFTTWILVAVTVDRCIAVCLPFKARLWCTMQTAKIALAVIAGVLVIINGHLFWTLGIQHIADETQCIGLYHFNFEIWPWIDFTKFSFLPFTVMIACNIILARHLLDSIKKLRLHAAAKPTIDIGNSSSENPRFPHLYDAEMTSIKTPDSPNVESPGADDTSTFVGLRAPTSEHMVESPGVESPTDLRIGSPSTDGVLILPSVKPGYWRQRLFQLSVTTPKTDTLQGNSHTISKSRRARRVPSLTAMLLTINCLFLVMTVPVVIYLIGFPAWYISGSHQSRANMSIYWAIANMFQYLNNTIHFFLYCLTCPKFRIELHRVVCSGNKVSTASFQRSISIDP